MPANRFWVSISLYGFLEKVVMKKGLTLALFVFSFSLAQMFEYGFYTYHVVETEAGLTPLHQFSSSLFTTEEADFFTMMKALGAEEVPGVAETIQVLDALGRFGWELVAFERNGEDFLYIMKREVE